MTQDDYTALLLAMFGDAGQVLTPEVIAALWAMAPADQPLDVQYRIVLIGAIDVLLGNAAALVDFRALNGASVNAGDLFDHLLQLRGVASDELDALLAASGGAGAIGLLRATAPERPPPGMPDANSPAYRGSPYTTPFGVVRSQLGRRRR